jgi:hypothetical protein
MTRNASAGVVAVLCALVVLVAWRGLRRRKPETFRGRGGRWLPRTGPVGRPYNRWFGGYNRPWMYYGPDCVRSCIENSANYEAARNCMRDICGV